MRLLYIYLQSGHGKVAVTVWILQCLTKDSTRRRRAIEITGTESSTRER